MDQINARDVNSSSVDSFKLSDAKTDWIVPMWRSRCKHSLLGSFKFRWLNLSLLVVVIIQTNVEDEDDPDVAEAVEAFKARRVDFVDEGHPSPCILHES